MKKIVLLLTILIMVISLHSIVFALDKTIDCKIYDADVINANKSASSPITATYVSADGGNSDYVHITSKKTGNSVYFRFDPIKSDLEDDKFVPDFAFSDYPVVMIYYRSNIETTNGKIPINAGLLLSKTGKYERCWSLTTDFISNNSWRKAIIDIRTFLGYDGGSANVNAVASNSGVRYIRIPIWANASNADTKNDYFDIQYIGFFKSVKDAEEYGGKDEELKTYTVVLLDKDGKKFSEISVFEGTPVALGNGPKVEYYDFIGWEDENGEIIPSSLKFTSDITLRASYRLNEAEYAKAERSKIVADAKKKGLERIDKPFISGYDGFEFRPENNMTRAEACTVITRLITNENTIDTKLSTAFTDLSKDAWYYKYITYLESIGYLKSYSGEFEPNRNITRAEFVELVYNMGKISGGDKKVSFKDVPADHPRHEVIMAAAKAGLINGKYADTFDPDGNIKRSEVVKVLCIALGRIPNKNSFDDVVIAGLSDVSESHWAFPYIIEAAFEHKAINDNNGEEIWIEMNDTNNYYNEVPVGLIDTLEATFAKRVEEIRNTKSEWTVALGGTVWYFSDSEGVNTNDGKSPSTPMKTLQKLERMQNEGIIKPGDVVLFKRGDEWYDQLKCADGVTYSAYGEGDKPLISTSIKSENAADWIETDTQGVYKYKANLKYKKDIANIVFNNGECYAFRIVINAETNKILNSGDQNLVSNGIKTWMNDNRVFEGYKTLAEYGNDIPDADLVFYYNRATGDLYLYSREGNPADRFEVINICTYDHGINVRKGAVGKNITIDNLCVKYAGSHGIAASSTINLTVRNCEVGWIGGAMQYTDELSNNTRYGNGIEVYGTADGFYVYNNYVYECFDCGPTIQWSGNLTDGTVKIAKDIEIHSNVVREGSLEVWFTTTSKVTGNTYLELRNCRLYNNYVTGSGTGWKAYNHQKFEWTSFYGGGATNAYYNDCYIENNYFWNNRRHLIKAVPTTTVNGNGFTWRNNVIIHPDGEGSIGYMGADAANGKGAKTQYFYDKDTINTLVKSGAFGLNKFYYTPGDAVNRRDIIKY